MSANEFLPIPSSPLSPLSVSDDTRTQSAAHASFLCHRLQRLRQGVGQRCVSDAGRGFHSTPGDQFPRRTIFSLSAPGCTTAIPVSQASRRTFFFADIKVREATALGEQMPMFRGAHVVSSNARISDCDPSPTIAHGDRSQRQPLLNHATRLSESVASDSPARRGAQSALSLQRIPIIIILLRTFHLSIQSDS